MSDIKSIVVTGATSSIGVALCEACVEQGIRVIAVIQPASAKRSILPQSELLTVIESDIEEYDSIDTADMRADALVHLAWKSTNGAALRDDTHAHTANIDCCLKAVELAARLGCEVFIGAGSQAEYGRTDEVLTENTECHPETAYGMAKLCAGQMSRLLCEQKGIRHIWTRILSAYGPYCNLRTVISYTINELLNGREPELSDGRQIWNFIYTGDIADALIALARDGKDKRVYVIGSNDTRKLSEFLLETGRVLAPDITVGLGRRPYNADAVMHLECDISPLMEDTGYVPKTAFADGILKTAEWMREYADNN